MKKPLPRDNASIKRYGDMLADIKNRIQQAQTRAVMSANSEMIHMYWDIGRMVAIKQDAEGWGTAVIPRLAVDLRSDLLEIKGFSERNLGRMIAFFRAYSNLDEILPQPVAKLNQKQKQGPANLPQAVAKTGHADAMKGLLRLVPKIPWGHNILLMEKVKDVSERLWYMEQVLENGWSRAMLSAAIKSNAHDRQGAAVTNFDMRLPEPHAQLAQDTLKDPCQDKKRVLAEYALRGMKKPIGISEYELTRALPEELKSTLPTIEEIEAELSAGLHDENEGEV